MNVRLSRRDVMIGLTAAIGGSFIEISLPILPAHTEEIGGYLARQLEDLPVHLGRLYLQSAGGGMGAQELTEKIQEALARVPPQPDLSKRVAAVIRSEYIDDQVVHLSGWIFSLTEARLCALKALAADTQT
ncbi:MAG: hypothetical protein AB7G93_21300 [Bdellovibrionales bacterium]